MQFVDTHCHIHEATTDTTGDKFVQGKWAQGGFTSAKPLIDSALKVGVSRLICVGCTLRDSQLAVALAVRDPHCVATIGIHPHEAKDHLDKDVQKRFAGLATNKQVVAIGECGLDYFYTHSTKDDQITLLKFQLELAQKYDLPLIFHVREAFGDFWPIFDAYKGLRGVVHSFSSNTNDLDDILSRGLYVGLNGIMTFTKSKEQLEAAKKVPLDRLLLETDAPFLTPTPFRGTICEPKYVQVTAEFLGRLRDESLGLIASSTTKNAQQLFGLE